MKRQRVQPSRSHDMPWRVIGVSDHYSQQKQCDYGRSGMVVLGIITKDNLPKNCQVNHEIWCMNKCCFITTCVYMLYNCDKRAANVTFGTTTTEYDIKRKSRDSSEEEAGNTVTQHEEGEAAEAEAAAAEGGNKVTEGKAEAEKYPGYAIYVAYGLKLNLTH